MLAVGGLSIALARLPLAFEEEVDYNIGMQTLKLKTMVHSDGHLRLDIPTSLPEGEVDLVVVIDKPSPSSRLESFKDLVGTLQWQGDALQEQRKLRDEWR